MRMKLFAKLDLDHAVFVIFLFLFLLPVWCVTYPPLQDAPAYLLSALAAHDWNDPVLGAVYHEYYHWNPAISTNWATQAILIALLKFLAPLTALKTLLSFYALLLPLAARYALRALNPEPGPSMLLIFPFLYTMVYQYGFLNFSLGLVLFFLFAGYLIRHRLDFTPRTILSVLLFSVLAYFTHLVALGMSAVTLLVVGTWSVVSLNQRGRQERAGKRTRPLLILAALLAILPGCVLAVRLIGGADWFFRGGGTRAALRGMAGALDDLLLLRPMIAVSSQQRYLVGLLLLLFLYMVLTIVWTKYRAPVIGPPDGLILLPIAYTCTFLLACGLMGTDLFLIPRLVLFPYFGLVIWVGAYRYPAAAKWVIRTMAAAVSLGILVTTAHAYLRLEPALKEYVSAAKAIPPRATLLSLSFDNQGHDEQNRPLSYRSLVFLHPHGYIAAQQRCLDLSNYQAGRSFFPMIYRRERSPYLHIARIEAIEALPAWLDLLGYPRRSGGRIDFILTWCLPDDNSDPRVKYIKDQLQEGFKEVYVSPHRLARVFQSKSCRR